MGSDARRLVVAVDGGAATGKSTVCEAVARTFSIPYFNAGLLYRALARACIEFGVDASDPEACAATWADCDVMVEFVALETRILLGGRDVTSALRSTDISQAVPAIARHPEVRRLVTDYQRSVLRSAATTGGVIIDGRDATSVVAPDANVKILLLASDDIVRSRSAARATFTVDQSDARSRNRADSDVSDFLQARDDVISIDTDRLDVDGVINQVQRAVRAQLAAE